MFTARRNCWIRPLTDRSWWSGLAIPSGCPDVGAASNWRCGNLAQVCFLVSQKWARSSSASYTCETSSGSISSLASIKPLLSCSCNKAQFHASSSLMCWLQSRIIRLGLLFSCIDNFSALKQYDPETSPPDDLPFTSAPQVMLAYYKYQWSLGDDIRRRDAFHRLQVCSLFNYFVVWNLWSARLKKFWIKLLTISIFLQTGHCSWSNREK